MRFKIGRKASVSVRHFWASFLNIMCFSSAGWAIVWPVESRLSVCLSGYLRVCVLTSVAQIVTATVLGTGTPTPIPDSSLYIIFLLTFPTLPEKSPKQNHLGHFIRKIAPNIPRTYATILINLLTYLHLFFEKYYSPENSHPTAS